MYGSCFKVVELEKLCFKTLGPCWLAKMAWDWRVTAMRHFKCRSRWERWIWLTDTSTHSVWGRIGKWQGWQGDLNDLRWKIFQWWIPVTWRISLTWKLEGGLEDWLLRWLPGKCSPHTKAVTMRMFERVSAKNLKNSGLQMVGFVSWIHPSKTTSTIFVAAPAMI